VTGSVLNSPHRSKRIFLRSILVLPCHLLLNLVSDFFPSHLCSRQHCGWFGTIELCYSCLHCPFLLYAVCYCPISSLPILTHSVLSQAFRFLFITVCVVLSSSVLLCPAPQTLFRTQKESLLFHCPPILCPSPLAQRLLAPQLGLDLGFLTLSTVRRRHYGFPVQKRLVNVSTNS
jgi:hypothetical protein